MKSIQLLAAIALLTLASCGGSNGGGGSESISPRQEMEEMSVGNYYGVLRPVNIQSNGFIPYGAANFSVSGQNLQVNISADDDQPVNHRQSLHVGGRCPKSSDDLNGDGFIDYNEAVMVVGNVVIPLDDNLNSQKEGSGLYPKGRGMTYYKTASLDLIHTDLWKSDEDLSDEVIKLPNGRRLGLEGRVVLVHGTQTLNPLPASVASYPGESANISLPVLCTVLKRINP